MKRTILVHAEQGIGDEILFASCLPDLIAHCWSSDRGVRSAVSARCSADHFRKRSFRAWPDASIFAEPSFSEPIDYQIPIGSLPLHFRQTRDSFPRYAGSFLLVTHRPRPSGSVAKAIRRNSVLD